MNWLLVAEDNYKTKTLLSLFFGGGAERREKYSKSCSSTIDIFVLQVPDGISGTFLCFMLFRLPEIVPPPDVAQQ